ncbi:sce7726 family protein [Paenibacillus nicotianae]|uniref:Sce7726 family protein n=1 Tax=Paenibacillus nicotianae TaxID=1526551 RepID=A0ABW4V1G8_9BACL
MKTRDIDIRTSLHFMLNQEHNNEPDTLILDELSVCQGDARIDVAVVNGEISGYEIKSESDTLVRLPLQTEYYNKVFDKVTILSAAKYLEDIKDIVPDWWGIIQAEKDDEGIIHFFTIRHPKKNNDIEAYALAQLLWRDEAINILKERGLQKGLLSKPRPVLWDALAKKIPITELQEEIRIRLKARSNWKAH